MTPLAAGLLGAAAATAVFVLAVSLRRLWLVRRLDAAARELRDGRTPLVPVPLGLGLAVERLESAVRSLSGERAEMAERLARLARALDGIPQGVVVADAGGDVVLTNRAARGYADARHGDALVAAAVEQTMTEARRGHAAQRTLELYGPPSRTVVVTAVALGEATDSLGAMAVVDDVTERRQVEAMRRDFVANISHELKTPVGALALLAEALRDEAADADSAVVVSLAGRLTGEAERLGRVIDDLMELSRTEAGERLARQPVVVRDVLDEALARVQAVAEARGITVAVDQPPRRLVVPGDARQLTSAVVNLLDNAVKYSDDGGRVELRVRLVGAEVEITVVDHGIGIPARDLERIFERFYRVDRARSRESGGTGLGLAIVRHVVTNHDGEIVVESREGEGSTFRLRLPAGAGPLGIVREPSLRTEAG